MAISTTNSPTRVLRGNPASDAHQPVPSELVTFLDEVLANGASSTDLTAETARIDALEELGGTGAQYTSGGPVACATTANITLSGEQTIDGKTTSTDRVLVMNQTDPAENGIYVSAAGAWSRATDMDAAAEVNGTLISVKAGTANGLRTFVTYSSVETLGTDDIEFREADDASAYSSSLALKADADDGAHTGNSTFENLAVSGDLTVDGDNVMTAVSTLTSTQLIGCKDTPDDGTATFPTSSIVFATAAPVGAQKITTFEVYASGSGTITVGVWTKSGDDFTRIASTDVSAVAGYNTFSVDLPIAEGQYVGARGSVIRYSTEANGSDEYYNGAGATSFTGSSTAAFNMRMRMTVSGAMLPAEHNDRLATIEGALDGAYSIGSETTDVDGTVTAGNATYIFAATAPAGAATVDTIYVYASGSGTALVSTWTKSGDNFTRVHVKQVSLSAGENSVAVGIPVSEGQHVGVSSGLIRYDSGVGPEWYSGTAGVSSFTDASTATLALRLRFTLGGPLSTTNLGDRVTTLETFFPWTGKSFLFQGDSITDSSYSTWPAEFTAALGASISQNCALSGRGIQDSLLDRSGAALASGDFDDVDCVIFYMGQNNTGTTLGTISDATTDTTFYGYAKKFIEQILTWHPEIKIVLATQINVARSTALYNISQAMRDLSGLYGLPVVDLERTSGFNSLTQSTYITDGIHPDDGAGETLLAKAFIGAFRAIMPME